MDIEKDAEVKGLKIRINYNDDAGSINIKLKNKSNIHVKSEYEIDTDFRTKEKISNVDKNDKKSALLINFAITVTLLIALILFTWDSIQITPWLLLVQIIIVTPFFYQLIRTKEKIERDVIKAANDTFLFLVTAATTALLTLKTIPNYNIDPFAVLMTNSIGCLMIFCYTLLLIIKAIIASLELLENKKKYKSEK
ncbi:hypothetical protein H4F64_18480 [Pectobacterium brasiliense]|uniref:hypothetical protein n=1 Tax=Pectobacterium brasiliense TaxID=180957 RepID=UPI001968FBF7|nr:hypothetical protein [Pectobacterium brasiliense]MBN3192184.1 hypothetical protein [Pectobacterium brasiliense]